MSTGIDRVVAVVLAVGLASLPAHAQEPAPPPPPPVAPAAAAEPPSQPAPALSDDEEYARFAAALPADYDINYSYTPPAGGNRRSPVADTGGSGPSKSNPRALGIAGGTFMTLGAVLGIAGIGMGAAEASDSQDLAVPAIATGVSGGVLMLLGTGLLLGKRSARRKNGDLPPKQPMTDSQRKTAILLGGTSAGIGIVFLAGGAAIVAKDADSKPGITLLAIGGVLTLFSLWPIGRLIVNRSRKNNAVARLSPAPMMTRHGGGLGLSGSF